MSGKPSPEGILSLRLTLDKLAVIGSKVSRLQAEVAERSARLAELQAEQNDLACRVPEMLRSMDIASDGNWGWEGRIVWALRELAAQYGKGEA